LNRGYQWIALSLFLAAIGSWVLWYKASVLGFPVMPEMTTEVWALQARVELRRRNGPVKVSLELPANPSGFDVVEENFVSRGFGLSVVENRDTRRADWAIRRLYQPKTLYYRAQVSPASRQTHIAGRPRYPQTPELDEPFASAMRDMVDEVRAASADTRTFAASMLSRLNAENPDENTALFLSGVRNRQERIEMVQTVLAGAHIPTLQIHGLMLQNDAQRADIVTLLGVFNDQTWLVFDPFTGRQGMPDAFFTWWVGDGEIVSVDGAHLQDVQLSARRQWVSSLELAEHKTLEEGSGVGRISILQLPIQTQAVYAVLLMVPFGILVIVVLRNLVGFSSFGTFAPVLIALAFRETELLRGLLLFVLIVTLGLLFRFYLERLRLLLVPRLAAVVTIVVLLMATISIVSHTLELDTGLSVSLFPMVIISKVIERISVVWEERGALTAIREGIGSLAMAALAYVVMSNELMGYWVSVFPEIDLIVLSVIIALGRYTGFRLTELIRFRQLDSGRGD